jgi:hypothetical protein
MYFSGGASFSLQRRLQTARTALPRRTKDDISHRVHAEVELPMAVWA